jgi:hypothetical protein
VALAAWTVAGVFGAALALLPVALEGGPRGRVRIRRTGPAEATPRILVPGVPADELTTARAAGEAFPG